MVVEDSADADCPLSQVEFSGSVPSIVQDKHRGIDRMPWRMRLIHCNRELLPTQSTVYAICSETALQFAASLKTAGIENFPLHS